MGRSKDLATGETRFANVSGDTFTGLVNINNTYSSDTTEQLRVSDNTGSKLDFFGHANGTKSIQAYADDGSTFYNLNLQPLGGGVTMPNQPMFHAWCTEGANGAVSGNSSPTSFYVSLNVGSHFSSGTFTAPIDGKYRFYYSILSGAANGGYGLIQFTVNNSSSMGGGISSNWGQVYNYTNANDKCITRELLINLSANDYVKLQVNGSHTNFYWNGGYSYFGGHLIG